MKDCIFCKIVKKEIPCRNVWEDEDYLVFLDAFPTMLGQVLVIPKKHLSGYFFDLKESARNELMNVSKRIANAIDVGLKASRTGVVIEGLESDHVHVRLYPLLESGIHLEGKLDLSDKVMDEILEKIRNELN